ncbi:hypothetical protein ABIE41_000158 [Bosea sp. OAE506]|uniref:hypothetical protein n=1 Tax=Bosea sp. OAE506 TaxID=2663870 RepID=UPI00178BC39C
MPLSTLKEPLDLARAEGALDLAWRRLKADNLLVAPESDRIRLASMIVELLIMAEDEDDLAKRAIDKFKKSGVHRG